MGEHSSYGTDRIEAMFAKNIDLLHSTKNNNQTIVKKKFRLKNIFKLTSFLLKKLYKILPSLLKDLFFCLTVIHKSPSTKFFAKTRYDELRTLIDVKTSSTVLRSLTNDSYDEVFKTFKKGCYSTVLNDISELEPIINDVIDYAKPSHAGARPFFKDGKNITINNSFSAYYDLSDKDGEKITSFLNNSLDGDFNQHLSALAGYKCKLKDISYSLGIVFGENSNSEMHQDTYSSIAKGFIYLQDIDSDDAPFEYLEGSYQDAAFRSSITNKAILEGDTHSAGSTRLRNNELEIALQKFKLNSFTGPRGTFVVANTAGYHRKGAHRSSKPRISLNFEIKRKGIFSKALINLVS